MAELWGWIEVPLEELHSRHKKQPDIPWVDLRVFFLERLNINDATQYPVIDAFLRDLDERQESDREDLLADLGKLHQLGTVLAGQHADPDAAVNGRSEAAEETFDQNAWWAFLAECGPGWNGTDGHWVDFEPWLLAEAQARGFGGPTEALFAPVRGQGAGAVIAVFAEYGVVIQPPPAALPAEVPAEQPEPLPTPEEFASANMAELLAEDPEFADIPEERRMALIAEVLAEQGR
jgi:hypothetical protein